MTGISIPPASRHALDLVRREPDQGFAGGSEPETLVFGEAEQVSRDNVVAFAVQPGVRAAAETERRFRALPTSYEARPEFLARIPGGQVDTRETLVLTADGSQVVVDRVHPSAARLSELGWPPPEGAPDVAGAVIEHYEEPVAAVLSTTARSYFHFWPETAARALLFRERCPESSARLLVQFKREYRELQRPAFAMLGLPKQEVLEIRQNRVGRFPEVFLPSTAQISGSALSPTGIRRLRRVAAVPIGGLAPAPLRKPSEGPPSAAWSTTPSLPRCSSASASRPCTRTRSRWRSSAQLYSRAEVVLGVHGGALTNLLFAPAGCLVIELMPEQADRARRQLFWNLAAISDQTYAQIVCPVAGDPSEGTLRVDVRVDPAHLADVLASVLR